MDAIIGVDMRRSSDVHCWVYNKDEQDEKIEGLLIGNMLDPERKLLPPGGCNCISSNSSRQDVRGYVRMCHRKLIRKENLQRKMA